MLLQNTVTRSLADDLSQHERSLRMMLANLSSAIKIASGGDIGSRTLKLQSCARYWKILFRRLMKSPTLLSLIPRQGSFRRAYRP